ncbi:MAG TPA: DUF1501 domain-containing protein [Aliidongia sp.]|uniref:DUF1501 domain-containing protein n=1 Tax=Aliidongia sp. TaxID=1914230 RepID=UPI002DDCB66D|nr:DUF1501 domain-containing protein [Aliidongia sp.]HEV2675967.1 DUF1501 domain-containing protein [Aliidongia sp.]
MLLSRRRLLGSLGAGAGLAVLNLPRIAYASAPIENRLVVVMLRGALDGLAAVPPYGDPHYADRRAGLALPMPGQADGILALDHTFALNAALAPIQPLWGAGELLIVPATAGGYHTRSHFDAQDLLEMGLVERHGAPTGWLNRALADIQGTDRQRRLGLAVGPSVPLMLRGGVAVASWEPPNLKAADPTLLASLTRMYAGDKLLGPALADGIKAQNLSDEVLGVGAMGDDGKPRFAKAGGYGPGAFRPMAEAAGGLLAAPDGPRVAVIDMGGWDTHVGQGTVKGRLADNLRGLAEGLAQLKISLGPAWGRTIVLVMTEFGRTVAPNGTNGTDHGTASVALLLGGAIKGGRIAGDWPGLAQLEENRGLRMATDLRAVAKGVLRDHLGVSTAHLDTTVFPDSAAVRPLAGLVRT